MSTVAGSSSLEDQMKNLQRHFGAIVSTIKDLKSKVEDLNRKFKEHETMEVQEIIKTQRVIDEIVVANSDAIMTMKSEIFNRKGGKQSGEGDNMNAKIANQHDEMVEKQAVFDNSIKNNSESIKVLDEEIKRITIEKIKRDDSKREVDAAIKQLSSEIIKLQRVEREDKSGKEAQTHGDKAMSIKCRYFNSGYCKYRQKCKFSHPNNICAEINCEKENCPKRHPKACKYQKGANGCWRGNSCDYAHDTLVAGDANGVKFGCISCKHEWKETQFVVKHTINNMEVYFCLNCDDWVKSKERVFDQGWSLFDQDGNLNHFV